MQSPTTRSELFLVKLSGILLLAAFLWSWKPNPSTIAGFLVDLRLKFNYYSEANYTNKIYLISDKPLYEPGEVVWYSVFNRNGNTLAHQPGQLVIQLIGPQGTVEATQYTNYNSTDNIYKGSFDLKPDQPGGLYKLKVYGNNSGLSENNLAFEREFQVQEVVMPRLKLTLDFEQKAYGPGSLVSAKVKALTNENRPLSGTTFDFVVSLKGEKVEQAKGTIDKKGNALVKFKLPQTLTSTDGHLNLIFKHEGIYESVSKSIPIVLNKVQLNFFPEGGELVNGLQSQLAFRALNEFNKPADVSGQVLDQDGKVVASFSSFHDGMGEFSFKPEADKTYKARLTSPAGITSTYPLPEPMESGYVLQVSRPEGEVLKVNIRSAITARAALVGQIRGQMYYEKVLNLKPGDNPVEFSTADLPIGVLQLTLFDQKTIERAERLVFVNNHKQLQLKIKTDKEKYLPREKVRLTVSATDETGMPMPADVMVSVVDDQLLTYMNDKSSNILSWMLVETEIKGKVEEPRFYFDKEEPKAPVALDLLLKTGGWRRFTWQAVKHVQLPHYQYSGEKLLPKNRYKIEYKIQSGYNEVAGQVSLFNGYPIPQNSQVKLIRQGQLLQTTTPAADGFFRFRNTSQGKYDIEVLMEGYDPGLITGIEVEGYYSPHVKVFYPVKTHTVAGNTGKTKRTTQAVNVTYSPSRYTAKIAGKAIDKATREPLAFATVILKQKGVQKAYGTTDIDGDYAIAGIPPGTYTVETAYVGYRPRVITGVELKEEKTTSLRLELLASVTQLAEVSVTAYREPIIGPEKVGQTLSSEQIRKMATVDVGTRVATASGISSADGGRGLSLRGSRNTGTVYYVNGVKQLVSPNLPASSISSAKPRVIKSNSRNLDNKLETKEGTNKAKTPAEPHSYTRIREFAAPVYTSSEPITERTDFRRTLFWQPALKIGRSGVAVLEFYTGDDITSYNILVEGISTDGSPGRKEHKFYSQLPFSVAAKLPEVTLQHDRLSVPLILKNNTGKDVTGNLNIKHPEGWKFLGQENKNLVVKANSTATFYLDYLVTGASGNSSFAAAFEAQGHRDGFSQPVKVEQRGYPVSQSIAGDHKEKEYQLDMTNMTPGTAQISFSAYPSVVTDLLKGIEGILREPYGCFEQTASSSYPNLMVLDYLKEQDKPDLNAMARAEELMDKGYKRLTTFETKEKGYEWFGGVPAHEGLTAYGLLQFTDMKRLGCNVDPDMLERTQAWMLNRRDGNGGFNLSARGFGYGRADAAITNAYIVYSLAEAGNKELKKEMDQVFLASENSSDPYQLALTTNALFASGDKDRGQTCLTKLLKLQADNGSWTGTRHSVTYSTGQALQLETTALAVLAILKADQKPMQQLQKGVKFLLQSRNGYGSFGSTQATLLTLKALTAYARFSKRTSEDGTVQLYVESKKAGEKSYLANQTGEIQINQLEKHFEKPGNYRVKVQYQKTSNPLPYSMALNYYSNLPPSSPDCKVRLETDLRAAEAVVGSTVRYQVKLKNEKAEGLPMTLALIGIPAGMSVQPWQLKELQERKVIDYYEITGNRLVCYFRDMAPSEEVEVNLDLKAEFPGTFESPASAAYLYYTNEHKYWVAGTKISIKAE
ncbi:carboxypeptidase regulatory-like domain-containing protein [Adhaeribacter soli]|uniref:Alpha-2-macroglobulin domain-containing protein n=1 Tax=Adhaeribacter soli TaxID=2607655 RepID=A0A5N1J9H7_9BACT|nr:carboxypeptidase regulatory-like domain-containing protein [Adhaeribacter soli]KAA9345648.1 hypothetical protein F0P94_00740 [Adhaeribacter soli]